MVKLNIFEAFDTRDATVLAGLADYVARPNAIFIEIGSWKGYSTSVLGEVARQCNGTVYAVDTWKGTTGVYHHWVSQEMKHEDIFSIFKYNMTELNLDDIVHPLVMKSMDAVKIIADGIADLIFIDADHSYESVKEDIISWFPKVRTAGIICGHDCEGYLDSFPSEKQQSFRDGEEDSFINGQSCHPGVILALNDIWVKDFNICAPTAIWCKKKCE